MPTLRHVVSFATLLGACLGAHAASHAVNFVTLPGVAGPQGTTIFRADLSAVPLAQIQSITLFDSGSGIGGSSGAYSGFDLDAIRLSTTLAATAAAAASASGLDAFDFSPAGTLFSPGTQRPPVATKLNGTDPTGLALDDSFARLGLFDAIYFGPGSITLGDNGSIAFNLKQPVSTAGLYLYVGEVGFGDGEGLSGRLIVSDTPVVPEPSTVALMAAGLAAMGWVARVRRDRAGVTAA